MSHAQLPREGPAFEIPWLAMVRSEIRARELAAAEQNAGARLSPEETHKIQRRLELLLEQLPYYLGGAAESLARLEESLRRICAQEMPPHVGERNAIVIMPPEVAHPLHRAVDSFLDSARRAQNATMPYVSKVFKANLPKSMADYADHLGRFSTVIPASVSSLISAYWDADGRELKAYRDLGQHHVALCSEVRIRVAPDGSKAIFAALPDAPHEKALSKLQYTPPYVSVGPFCRRHMLRLFEFVYTEMYVLLRHLGVSKTATMMLGFKAAVHMGSEAGYHAPPTADLDELFWQTRERAKVAAAATFGALEAPVLT